MNILVDGQICSTRLTGQDERAWRGVVERRKPSGTDADDDILFHATVEVRSINALIKRDNEQREKNMKTG